MPNVISMMAMVVSAIHLIRKSPWVSTFLANVSVLALGLLTGILVARLLQPEGRGALAAVLFWPQLIGGVGLFSLNEAITYKFLESANVKRNLIPTIVALACAVGGGVAIVSWLALPVFFGPERGAELILGRWYLLAFVPTYILAMSVIAVEHAQLRFGMLNVYRLLVPFVYLLGLVWLWTSDAVSVQNIAIANLLGTLTSAMLALARQGRLIWDRVSVKGAYELVGLAVSFHGVAVLRLVNSQIDRLLVLALFGNYAVGIYAVACTYASSGLVSITESFLSMMFPRLVGQDRELQKAYIARGLRYSTLCIVAGTIPLLALAPLLVPFLFGMPFSESTIATQVLLIAYAPLAIRQILSRNLRGLGFTWPGAEAEIASLVVFLLLSLPFSIQWGLPGVGGASFVANMVSLVLLIVRTRASLGLRFRECWGLNCATVSEVVTWGYCAIRSRRADLEKAS